MDNIKIKVNDNREIRIDVVDGYVPTLRLKEYILEDGMPVKSYTLSRWDDYGFWGWLGTDDFDEWKKTNNLSFDFDKDHPLYIAFLHLLNGEDSLIIDDDDTYQYDKKYMKISNKDNKIYLEFVYDLEDKTGDIEKFHVFVKNICFDIRSKIDEKDLDTKERLYFFFQYVEKLLNEEYHQITLEEYLLDKNCYIDEVKKYIKKLR